MRPPAPQRALSPLAAARRHSSPLAAAGADHSRAGLRRQSVRRLRARRRAAAAARLHVRDDGARNSRCYWQLLPQMTNPPPLCNGLRDLLDSATICTLALVHLRLNDDGGGNLRVPPASERRQRVDARRGRARAHLSLACLHALCHRRPKFDLRSNARNSPPTQPLLRDSSDRRRRCALNATRRLRARSQPLQPHKLPPPHLLHQFVDSSTKDSCRC